MVGAERIELSKLSHPVMSRNPFPFGTYANNVRFDGPYIDASDRLALKHITERIHLSIYIKGASTIRSSFENCL